MDAGSKQARQRRTSQNSVSHRGLPKTDGEPHNCTVGMIAGFGRSWSERVACQLRGSVCVLACSRRRPPRRKQLVRFLMGSSRCARYSVTIHGKRVQDNKLINNTHRRRFPYIIPVLCCHGPPASPKPRQRQGTRHKFCGNTRSLYWPQCQTS